MIKFQSEIIIQFRVNWIKGINAFPVKGNSQVDIEFMFSFGVTTPLRCCFQKGQRERFLKFTVFVILELSYPFLELSAILSVTVLLAVK